MYVRNLQCFHSYYTGYIIVHTHTLDGPSYCRSYHIWTQWAHHYSVTYPRRALERGICFNEVRSPVTDVYYKCTYSCDLGGTCRDNLLHCYTCYLRILDQELQTIMSKLAVTVSSKCSLYKHFLIDMSTLQYYLLKPIPVLGQKMTAKHGLSTDICNRTCLTVSQKSRTNFKASETYSTAFKFNIVRANSPEL
jgi:hypothetical protein